MGRIDDLAIYPYRVRDHFIFSVQDHFADIGKPIFSQIIPQLQGAII